MDVLKQVEAALEEIADDGIENSRDRRTLLAAAALTALRGLGWKPIEEMGENDKDVVCGKYMKLYRKWEWMTNGGWGNKKAAQMSGYTHFCRPILPTPPKREASCKS
jgi:hypothetical protein